MSDYTVILAARMGSTRLPGKAIADYGAGPNLTCIIERWQASDRQPVIIFTTTTRDEDTPLAQLAIGMGLPVMRGDPANQVEQFDKALRTYTPDACYVARALADNPLVDVALADWRLDVLRDTGAEGLWYGGREAEITYAGTTDVWSRSAWDRIASQSSGSQLEHPGEYYWNNIAKFSVVQLPMPRREYLAPIRTELDTDDDLTMFKALQNQWGVAPVPTLWGLKWLIANPQVAAINADVPIKTQSQAAFPNHFKPWICDNCQGRGGSIVDGNLRVFCSTCGKPHTYYAHKPARIGPRGLTR